MKSLCATLFLLPLFSFAGQPAPGLTDENYTGPGFPTVELSPQSVPESQPFVHPGLMNSQADLDFVRARLKADEEPWTGALKALVANPYCKSDRAPSVTPDKSSVNSKSVGVIMWDGTAAYGNAVLWCLTGSKAYADKAIQNLNAVATNLKEIKTADNGQKLVAGFCGGRYASAAELLLHYQQPDGSTSGWAPEEAEKFKDCMKNVFYPAMGNYQPTFNGNWDAAMVSTTMCIGVLCDDHAIFNRGVDYFLRGKTNGAISHYIDASGQNQESSRDQVHAQIGLGMMVSICEIAKHQGLDLYGVADNRLRAGLEYLARYNLGEEVPSVTPFDLSTKGRERLLPIFEAPYQYYAVEKGLPMPYTARVLQKAKHRPEGTDFVILPAWGTLLAYRGPALPAASPAPTVSAK